MATAEDIFLTEQCETNGRWAIFESNSSSAWLYMTEPNSQKPSADAFVYSLVTPVTKEEAKAMMERGDTPVIVDSYSNDQTVKTGIEEKDIKIRWDAKGRSVVVFISGAPVTILKVGDRQGYSKGLGKDGFFGKPWNESVYEENYDN